MEELKEHTRQQLMKVLNSIFSFLEFTTEMQTEYQDGYMPTLDLKARLDSQNKISFQFFEKPTTSRYCVMQGSAMGEQSKVSILTQEVNRRLLNTSETEPQTVRDNILNEFANKMEVSGYSQEQRRHIMRRGIIRYETLQNLEMNGTRRLHRPSKSTLEERIRKETDFKRGLV